MLCSAIPGWHFWMKLKCKMILKTVFRAQADKTPGTTWSFTCWHFKGHQVALHTFPSRCMEIAITYSSNPRSFLSVMDATDVFFRVKPNFITLSSWFQVSNMTQTHRCNDSMAELNWLMFYLLSFVRGGGKKVYGTPFVMYYIARL